MIAHIARLALLGVRHFDTPQWQVVTYYQKGRWPVLPHLLLSVAS